MVCEGKHGNASPLLSVAPLAHFALSVLAPGRHNLQSFLAANSTQNYFLIARMLSFCDIRDKSAVFNILRQNETIFE